MGPVPTPSSPDITMILSTILGHSRGDASSAVTSQRQDGEAIWRHVDALCVYVCRTLRAELSVPPGRAGTGSGHRQRLTKPRWMYPKAGGGRFPADGCAVPFLPPLPLSLPPLPAPLTFSVLRYVPQTPRFLPAFVGLLQVHTQCLNRISHVGLGEFSVETLRVRMWGVVLVSGCRWSEQVLLASVRLSLCCRCPRLESSTTESTTWIAATSSYDT